MIDKIISRLKTGRIKNVVPYGYGENAAPPYIIVREEQDSLGRGIVYRIIGHMLPGQIIFLEEYMRSDISTLLDNYVITSRNGNVNELMTEQYNSGTIANNDDGTISRERRFLLPSIVF